MKLSRSEKFMVHWALRMSPASNRPVGYTAESWELELRTRQASAEAERRAVAAAEAAVEARYAGRGKS